ncbi:uncharacterized protein AMSG_01376 [Thecamonas trahens ATCC 50062]|uniref:FF domain-containing protein n=1 Tax=Thecamonas trahens ATCC 50062 TaxID=461836 RepID=A0A0L0DNT1_THETB|nr:hypothetical protein AMSG_01376 [Thecamonas trahens ATCC 50062]KNC53666.1 hypothetical protein AMSG_01376 [Thecamonas trahens ATCC 50062]|eukprot:XP_013761980.1 hypothetical protein AMSG_01376 [Thecamonas trahens ATCC 50062]
MALRPVYASPLLGSTGWRVVKTNAPDNHPAKVFYYHASSATSSWDLPAVLEPFDLSGFTGPRRKRKRDESGRTSRAQHPPVHARNQSTTSAGAEETAMPEAPWADTDDAKTVAQAVEGFRALLWETGITPFSDYYVMKSRLEKDARFAAVADEDDRRAIFEAVATEAASKKTASAEEQARNAAASAFCALIRKMLPRLPAKPQLYDLRAVAGDDPAYSGVGKLEREALFAREVSALREKKARLKAERKAKRNAAKAAYVRLLASLEDPALGGDSQWRTTRPRIADDPAFKALPPSKAEDYFYDYTDSLKEAEASRASVAKATAKVQAETARSDFLTLLAEFVKSPAEDYAAITDRLGVDPRWSAPGVSDAFRRSAVEKHLAELGTSAKGRLAVILARHAANLRLDWDWPRAQRFLGELPGTGEEIRALSLSAAGAAAVYSEFLVDAKAKAREAFFDMVDSVVAPGAALAAHDVADFLESTDPRFERAEQDPAFNALLALEEYLGSDEQAARRAAHFSSSSRAHASSKSGNDDGYALDIDIADDTEGDVGKSGGKGIKGGDDD